MDLKDLKLDELIYFSYICYFYFDLYYVIVHYSLVLANFVIYINVIFHTFHQSNSNPLCSLLPTLLCSCIEHNSGLCT